MAEVAGVGEGIVAASAGLHSTSAVVDVPKASASTRLPDDMPWPEPLLTTPRVTIRPYHPTDAPEISRIANNKDIAIWMTNRYPFPYTLDDAYDWISKTLNPKETGIYAWTLSLTPDGKPIGGCGLEPGSDIECRSSDMGYWLGEEYWGKGYGSEICAALTDYAFGLEQGIKGDGNSLLHIGADVHGASAQSPANIGSGKVLKKCGYKLEGVRKAMVWKWGESRDLEFYGMTRDEWEQRRRGK